jgi:DNA-binding response OmpR family regulator
MMYAGGTSIRGESPKKVLIVDRDKFWGPSMNLALEETGYYLNWVTDPGEGRRRVIERVYDLVVLSDSLGEPAVASILATVARGPRPPAVLLLANGEMPAQPGLSVVRRPCDVNDVVDEARRLVGTPGGNQRKGA